MNETLDTSDAHLRRRLKMMDALLSSVEDFVYSFDRQGRFSFANKALSDLLKRTPHEMIGRNFHDLGYPVELATRLQAQIEEVFVTGKTVRDETPFTDADGNTGFYEYVFTPVLGSDGSVESVAGSTRDVSVARQSEQLLQESEQKFRQMADELWRSNRELAEFAYVASHDLKEPLRKVANYAELLARTVPAAGAEIAARYAGHITSGVARMQNLIEDLLSFSRLNSEENPREPVDLAETIRDVKSDLETAIAQAGARVTAGVLPTVVANPLHMQQLFQNLVGNAIKFRGAAAPVVSITCREEREFFDITVADNGIGIEPRYFEQIFKIFNRLHGRDRYSGTGIGLAICKKIVESYGGKIWVESTPGAGSRFRFTLRRSPN